MEEPAAEAVAVGGAPDPRPIDVRVVTAAAGPIADAEIAARSDSGRSVAHRTGPDGRALIELDAAPHLLAATAAGFVTAEETLEPPFPDELVLTLRDGVDVRGVVVDPTGMPVGAGIRVVGVGTGQHHVSRERLRLALDGGLALVPVARTDDAGTFQLRGLDSSQRYQLHAGGEGCAATGALRPWIVPDPTQPVRVEVLRVYGLRVVLRDEQGRRPRLGPRLAGDWQGRPRPSEARARRILAFDWMRVLVGLDDALAPETFDERAFLFESALELSAVPFDYAVALPGYAPLDAKLRAPRLAATLATETLELSTLAAGFGSLTIRLEPAELAADLLAGDAEARSCRIRLTDVVAGTESYASLPRLASGAETVDGLPFGRYEVVFTGPGELFRHPGSDGVGLAVEIGELPATTSVDISRLGAISIELEARSGLPFTGRLTGSLVHADTGRPTSLVFVGPPYVVGLLEPGAYELKLSSPSVVEGAAHRVDVRAGAASRLVLHVGE